MTVWNPVWLQDAAEAALLSRIEQGQEEAGTVARDALVYREGQRAILEEARRALRPMLEAAEVAVIEGEGETPDAPPAAASIIDTIVSEGGGHRDKRARVVVPFPPK